MHYLGARLRPERAARAATTHATRAPAAASASSSSSSLLTWRRGGGAAMWPRSHRRRRLCLVACVLSLLVLLCLLVMGSPPTTLSDVYKTAADTYDTPPRVGGDAQHTATSARHSVLAMPVVACPARDNNDTSSSLVWSDAKGNVYVRLNSTAAVTAAAEDKKTYACTTDKATASAAAATRECTQQQQEQQPTARTASLTSSQCFITPRIRIRDRTMTTTTTTMTSTTPHAAHNHNKEHNDDDDDDDDAAARRVGNVYTRWYSLLRPDDAYTVPSFATDDEVNTLTHASIFVSVAAYFDKECATTLLSALRAARYRHRLYFGISEEIPSRSYDTVAADDDDDDDDASRVDDIRCLRMLLHYTNAQQAAVLAGNDAVTQTVATHIRTSARTPQRQRPSTATTRSHAWPRRLSSAQQQRLRAMLYGDDAPSSLALTVRELSWDAIAQSRGGLTTSIDELAGRTTTHTTTATLDDNNSNSNTTTGTTTMPSSDMTVPTRMYVHEDHVKDSIVCIAGGAETVRDRYLLQLYYNNNNNNNSAHRHRGGGGGAARVFRRGRGGAQELPSTALAGCRVTVRTSSNAAARGPVYSRYVTSLLYHNQDYMLVIDSHTRFVRDWDTKLIRSVFQLPTRGVLSHYPNGYTPAHPTREYANKHVMHMCTAVLTTKNYMPQLGAEWQPLQSHPRLAAFVAGGFLFGDAQFVHDVPYDPIVQFLFVGEEALQSSRLWTTGWDIYSPMELLVLHNYERTAAPRFWSNMNNNDATVERRSEQRALYLMRRPRPWVEVVKELLRQQQQQQEEEAKRAHSTSATSTPSTNTTLSYVAPEERLLVSDAAAAAQWPLAALQSYYGQGTQRRLEDYWHFAQLTDEFVKTYDKERRLRGGDGLCKLQGTVT